jgi:hypothetical protein
MDANHTGETSLSLGDQQLTLVFDWRAMSAVRTLLKGGDIFAALAGQDPDMLAALVAIGARRHHPDVTAESVLDASPPLVQTQAAVVKAINRAFWGAEVPPPADPPQPAGKKSPAGAGSPRL